ncbi:DUF1659 domain-containing protein [Furfurilactobacillus rossiae]|uniref:DUF1659 domain-containing protein n=1 Tax=Furfurilactobacillus rossiae DSM 15814 TaxID=1114972 RepID=A0A0R1RJW6_9LACO|nr:hypothetical protein [Furfurilactobacillus rossiae]KRL57015.1 hypothetical protein FD35_GL000019 [Furfurilactobacillus rossiae DSM 15814]QFR66091.1 hypothetical protein LR814_02745 [Furfurilactobacillus rossiae]QLE61516.1 hypothetical protein LROSRS0_1470 [Furfurilactobacillus rossiae]
MSQKWLKTSVQYLISGEGHSTPIKRNYNTVAQNITDDQLNKFGAAIASLSNDSVNDIFVTTKQEANA